MHIHESFSEFCNESKFNLKQYDKFNLKKGVIDRLEEFEKLSDEELEKKTRNIQHYGSNITNAARVVLMLRAENGKTKIKIPEHWYDDVKEAFKMPARKWVKLPEDYKDENAELIKDLIDIAYAAIGGHLKFRTADDVRNSSLDVWKGIDLDAEEPDLDLVVFGKETKYGVKWTGVGHNGTKEAKTEYINKRMSDLKDKGNYLEASSKIAEIIMHRFKVNIVSDKESIEKVLGKDIIFLGKHPNGTTPGDGWYTRMIGGVPTTKIMLGKPKV